MLTFISNRVNSLNCNTSGAVASPATHNSRHFGHRRPDPVGHNWTDLPCREESTGLGLKNEKGPGKTTGLFFSGPGKCGVSRMSNPCFTTSLTLSHVKNRVSAEAVLAGPSHPAGAEQGTAYGLYYTTCRAVTSPSCEVVKLPLTRSAMVRGNCECIPIGPNIGTNFGIVIRPASRRAIENAVPC
jgi:hypothetical protein